MSNATNIAVNLSSFTARSAPRIVARMNDLDVMVVKVQGNFVWHKHDDTDDFFLVLKDVLEIQLLHSTVTVREGEMFVVPRRVEHRPRAVEKCHLMILGAAGAPNASDVATATAKKTI